MPEFSICWGKWSNKEEHFSIILLYPQRYLYCNEVDDQTHFLNSKLVNFLHGECRNFVFVEENDFARKRIAETDEDHILGAKA